MADKLVFILPESLESILWVAPVLMQYLEDRLLGNPLFGPRPPEKVTVVCKWPELTHFLKCCWRKMDVVSVLGANERNEADLLFDFDVELSYDWTKLVDKHISVATSFLLGTISLTKFPPVAMELGIEIPGLVLLVTSRSWMEGHRDWLWDWKGFFDLGVDQKITMNVLDGSESWSQMRKEISRASVVIGIRGAATLMAAAMGKVVMELTPNTEHKDWTAKWESSRYRMIYGKPEEFPAEFILERTGRMLKDLARTGELSWVRRPHPSTSLDSKELAKAVG